jgi:hypothetical protein
MKHADECKMACVSILQFFLEFCYVPLEISGGYIYVGQKIKYLNAQGSFLLDFELTGKVSAYD